MKRFISSLILTLLFSHLPLHAQTADETIVTATKRIYLPDSVQGAHNPSIIEFGDGYLLCFRHIPNRWEEPYVSHIGLVMLDKTLNPISAPTLLDTRLYTDETPSQSEDARIINIGDKIYVVYNDNEELLVPYPWERRDMFIAQVLYDGQNFTLDEPLKLVHEIKAKHREAPWQKNWTPFAWQDQLMFIFEINPLEVLNPNLSTGVCKVHSKTKKEVNWDYGGLRGGTPALLVDGEYLAFFHSGMVTTSPSSDHRELWHYYMGAYTFSASPPFELTGVSASPIMSPEFYTYSSYEKRVIYPGGFVIDGTNLYLAYGKDDCEICIATIDLNALRNSLVVPNEVPEVVTTLPATTKK